MNKNVKKQIADAIRSGKKSITINKKIINLPSPQTAGTDKQKYDYGEIAAEHIMKAEGL